MKLTLRFNSLFRPKLSRSRVALLVLGMLMVGASHAQTPQHSYQGTGSNNIFPFQSTTTNRVQWLFVPSTHFPTATSSGLITAVYFRANTSSTATTYTNLTVRMGPTTLSVMPTAGSPWLAGLTTVYSAPTTTTPALTTGQWFVITLQTPYSYNPGQNLVVDVSQTAYTGGGIQIMQGGVNSRMWGSAASPTSSGSGTGLANFGFDIITCTGTPTQPVITTPAMTSPVCAGTSVSISATSGGNTSQAYQWQQSSSSTGPWTSVVGGTGANTLNYSTATTVSTNTWFRLRSSCGSTSDSSAPYQVLVNNVPNAGAISGPTQICAGQSYTYSIAPVSNATSYSWTLPNGWTGSSTTNTITVTPNGTGILQVVANNACGVELLWR